MVISSGGKTIKALSVFGTRPDAVKMAPVVAALNADSRFESAVCVTGQHRGMLDDMTAAFGVHTDFDLDIMTERQTLTDITVKALTGLKGVYEAYKPDAVLVHGDTTTAMAAAMAAFYAKIKVGHVEAGLRTDNKLEPYPEEMNRRMADVIADYFFAPTETAKDNLLRENAPASGVFVTGNTAVDAVRIIAEGLETGRAFDCAALNGLDFENDGVIAVTAHRRENLGEPLADICRALKTIAQRDHVKVVYAVHPNPAVRETVWPILSGARNVVLTEPLGIRDMYDLIGRSRFVLTDSGGLQEEAPALGKPVVVLRNVTERPEGVAAGTLKLAGTNAASIVGLAEELLTGGALYKSMAAAKNPFGDGRAAERVANALAYAFGSEPTRPKDFA